MRFIPFAAALSITAAAHAQATQPALPNVLPAAQASLTPRPFVGRYDVTRLDMARSFLRCERAFLDHSPTGDDLARANLLFDQATIDFFSGEQPKSLSEMNALTQTLSLPATNPTSRPAGVAFLDSLKVRVSPSVAQSKHPSLFKVWFAHLYPATLDEPLNLRLQVARADDSSKVIFDQPVRIDPGEALPMIRTAQPDAPAGAYVVRLICASGGVVDVGKWFVADQSLEVTRRNNLIRLAGFTTKDPAMTCAVYSVRARNGFISDFVNESDSASFLADPVSLSKSIDGEIDALLKGNNPYQNRAGDYWRIYLSAAMQMPARIYAPEKALAEAVKDDRQLPLVIALHGLGGDESMFMDAYGDGLVKNLADEKGFIVVTPNVAWATASPAGLKALIDETAFDYPIDKARVYLIGHSLGAVAATTWATEQSDKIAAAVLFSGAGSIAAGKKCVPTMVYAGENDPIAPASRVEQTVQDEKAAGNPIEFKLVEGYGHTLVVPAKLPEAIDWLLRYSKHVD